MVLPWGPWGETIPCLQVDWLLAFLDLLAHPQPSFPTTSISLLPFFYTNDFGAVRTGYCWTIQNEKPKSSISDYQYYTFLSIHTTTYFQNNPPLPESCSDLEPSSQWPSLMSSLEKDLHSCGLIRELRQKGLSLYNYLPPRTSCFQVQVQSENGLLSAQRPWDDIWERRHLGKASSSFQLYLLLQEDQ